MKDSGSVSEDVLFDNRRSNYLIVMNVTKVLFRNMIMSHTHNMYLLSSLNNKIYVFSTDPANKSSILICIRGI